MHRRAESESCSIKLLVQHLLFPSTDRHVMIQAIIVFSILAMLIAAPHRYRETRLFVIGVALVTAGLFGLRALH